MKTAGLRDLRKEFPEKIFFLFQHRMKGRDKASDKQHTMFGFNRNCSPSFIFKLYMKSNMNHFLNICWLAERWDISCSVVAVFI